MTTLSLRTEITETGALMLPANCDAPDTAQPRNKSAATMLCGMFQVYRWRMLLTYGFINLENMLSLAQPYCLGWAINDLVADRTQGLWFFIGQYCAHLAAGVTRRVYDVRAFTGIYTDLATRIVDEHRRNGIEISRITARSSLSRAFVDFFQQHLPLGVQALYSIAGGLVMVGFYEPTLVALCLGLIVPAWYLNAKYRRRSLLLNEKLHDQMEREVDVLQSAPSHEVRRHYSALAQWTIRLTQCEAANFACMEIFVLGLLVVALLRTSATATLSAGDLFAVFRYVLTFVTGLDAIPLLIQQVSRLQDLGRRLQATT